MHKRMWAIWLLGAISIVLSGCSFVAQQLSDKDREEQLLKPGSLDAPIQNHNFNIFIIPFIGKYKIQHEWLLSSYCGYRGFPTRGVDADGYYRGSHLYVDPIFLQDHLIVQRRINYFDNTQPPGDVDLTPYFRSQRLAVPTRYEMRNGKIVIAEQEEKEFGFKSMCFESWEGVNMSVALHFYELSSEEWWNILSKGYLDKGLKRHEEKIGQNVWNIFTIPPQPNPISQAYKFYITEVGDSGFTIAWALGANEESLKHPEEFEAMEQMFMRLIRSTKIEPWNEQAAREMEQLKRKAMEVKRQDCIEKYLNRPTKAPVWCKQYLQ